MGGIKSGADAPANLPTRARWYPARGMRPSPGNKTGLLCRACVRRLPVNITGGNAKYRRCTIRRTFGRGRIQIGLITGNVTVLDNWIETVRCGETLEPL